MTRRHVSLVVATLTLAGAAACTARPPLSHARSLEGRGRESHATVRTTIAAAIVVPAPKALHRARRAASKMRLYTEDSADCPSEALGVVNERAPDGDEAAAMERMKAKARRMGADAVVGYHTAGGGAAGVDLAGVAVRCNRLTEDRPYDTIASIEVPAEDGATPGSDQRAFDELLARADQMNADLVVDVHVVPGKDGAKGKVVGSAIKYR